MKELNSVECAQIGAGYSPVFAGLGFGFAGGMCGLIVGAYATAAVCIKVFHIRPTLLDGAPVHFFSILGGLLCAAWGASLGADYGVTLAKDANGTRSENYT